MAAGRAGGGRRPRAVACAAADGGTARAGATLAVVVEFGGGAVRTRCTEPGGTGIDVLRRAGFAPVTQSFGSEGGDVGGVRGEGSRQRHRRGLRPGPDCLKCLQPDSWVLLPGLPLLAGRRGQHPARCGHGRGLALGSVDDLVRRPAIGRRRVRRARPRAPAGHRPADHPTPGRWRGGDPPPGRPRPRPRWRIRAPVTRRHRARPIRRPRPRGTGSTTTVPGATTTTAPGAPGDEATTTDAAEVEAAEADRPEGGTDDEESAAGLPASSTDGSGGSGGGGAPVVPLLVTALVVGGVAVLAVRARRARGAAPPTPGAPA